MDTFEENEVIKMEVVVKEDYNYTPKATFQERASQQFWEYIKNKNVLEILQPSLTLLYEMPVKPTNIYEFLAEFLENGSQDLLKISLLQTELCYQQNELKQLPQSFLNNESSSRPVSTTLVQKLNLSNGITTLPGDLFRMDSLTTLTRDSRNALDYISLQDDAEKIHAILRSRGLRDNKIFKLEDLPTNDPTPSKMEESVRKKKSKRSTKTRKTKGKSSKDVVKKSKSAKDVAKKSKSAKDVARKSKSSKSKEKKASKLKKKDIGKTAKGKRKRRKPENDQAETAQSQALLGELKEIDEETQTSSHKLSPQSSINELLTTAQKRRIAKLVAAINNPDERMAMENDLTMISDHKKIDPWGILFDFNRQNAERNYELELFATGASDDYLLRPLNHQNTTSQLEGSVETAQQDGDGEGAATMQKQQPQDVRELFEEFTKIPTALNYYSKIRDGLTFLHNFKKSEIKAMKERRFEQLSSGLPESCTNCLSDVSVEHLSEEDTRVRNEQFLRMLVVSYGDCKRFQKIKNVKKLCPHEEETAIGHRRSKINMSPFETTRKQTVAEVTTFKATCGQPIKSSNRLTRKKVLLMFEALVNMYRKHLEIVDSIEQPEEASVDISDTFERTEMKQRLETLVCQKVDVTLSAIKTYLLNMLKKERQIRVKTFLKKRDKCRNFGYTKLEPFEQTKQKEARHDAYSIAAPTISEKEIQRFLCRFDSHGNFNSEGLRTKTDFLYDFPLSDVKGMQRWIDMTFQESVWRLNEPLGDPQHDHDFDDDDDDNYIWIEDYNGEHIPTSVETLSVPHDEENVPISSSDMEKIQQFRQDTESSEHCVDDRFEHFQEKVCKVKVIEEKNLPKGIPLVKTGSLSALLQKRPFRKTYVELKPSERARQYVQKAFNTEIKENLLNNFAFEILDED